MMRVRFRERTRQPRASHILRICRFSPCVKIIQKEHSPVRVTLQGRVTVSKMGTPVPMEERKESVTGLSMVT